MKRSSLPIVALALAVPLVVGTVQAASASAPAKPARPAAPASHATHSSKVPGASPAALSGYTQVASAALSDPAGQQVSGDATCPRGTKVVGGGAVISSLSLAENINSSFPFGNRTWRTYVSNSSGTDGTFIAYAVCVSRVANYSIVSGTPVDNPAGTQVSATVACPSGTVPFGGGGVATSFDTQVNLNTSIPQSTGWRIDANNNSAGDSSAVAYAVCGTQPVNYTQKHGPATTVNAGTQAGAAAKCPAGTVVFSGGAFSSSGSVLVDLNSSYPTSSKTWQAYENNNTASSSTVTAYAVCGKAAS